MAWGTVTVGGVALREELTAQQTGERVKIAGQESHPPNTRAHVVAVHHNLSQLSGLVVPVTFTDKTELTGFYLVGDVESVLDKVQGGSVLTATWQATLARIGAGPDVEVESRVPTVGRLTDHAVSPVFWHAPAVGFDSYFTGATVPSGSVARAAADGTVTVFTGIPASVAPRWTIGAEEYLVGSARLLFDGIRRVGTITPPLTVWEIHNGLVKLTSGPGGQITVSCWDAGDWRSAKSYAVTVNGAALTTTPELTILRNDPEEVTVRLTYPSAPGRVTVDLGLRRGSRFLTGVIKRHSAATLGVVRASPEGATASTGRIAASSADADGNFYVLGSAKSFTADTTNGGISKASVTRLDFFAGHALGPSPQAGDTSLDLLQQYLGSTGERVRIVRR